MMQKAILVLLGLFLCGVGCLVAMIATGLIREAEPANDGVFALQTLHRSTASKVQEEATTTSMVFDGGRRAIIPENLWDSRYLYLIHLDTEEVTKIELPTSSPLAISSFIYAEESVFALFYEDDPMVQVAYRIDSDGDIRPVRFLEYITHFTTEEPFSADEITPLLEDGKLEGLTELQKEICKEDGATGEMQRTTLSLVHHFFNDDYLLETNISTMKETLRSHSIRTISDGCVDNRRSLPGGITLELTRLATHNEPHRSESDARIISARLYRDDVLLHEYQFGKEFYFQAVSIGDHLYFVGNHVKYLDLAQVSEQE